MLEEIMRTAATSGGGGDCVYAIKVMHILGVHTIYVKENAYPEGEGTLYSNLKPLLEVNGFEVLPTKPMSGTWEFELGLRFAHNLDSFRGMRGRSHVHIMINQHRAFGLPDPSNFNPWLKIDEVPSGITGDVTLIHVTERWRDGSHIRWAKVLEKIEGEKYFIGLKIDHERFENEIGGKIKHFITKDFLELARAIRDCKQVYCNQGVATAICQGIGKDYWLEKKPRRFNVLTRTINEHILNPD